jgi:hypothetical protein
MRPNIFVSSTIHDLQHLRDAIRDTIMELGFIPIMTDYGDVGYLPSVDVHESCYLTIRECQITVLIIGKRYGSRSSNGFSVTQNEFVASKAKNIPVISLIDEEVLQFKRVFDENSTSVPSTFPGMDDPIATFGFINDIARSVLNNGFISYRNVSDAQQKLKYQMAHLFGDLLRKGFDPVKGEIRDVLSEIKTLRHELMKEPEKTSARVFLRSIRFLLEDRNRWYRDLAEQLYHTLEDAVSTMVGAETFDEFIKTAQAHLTIESNLLRIQQQIDAMHCLHSVQQRTEDQGEEAEDRIAAWGYNSDKTIFMNPSAKRIFDSIHEKLKAYATHDKTDLL